MIVDTGRIVVQIFSDEGRKHYNLEDHWAKISMDKSLYGRGDLSDEVLDDLCEKYPVPET